MGHRSTLMLVALLVALATPSLSAQAPRCSLHLGATRKLVLSGNRPVHVAGRFAARNGQTLLMLAEYAHWWHPGGGPRDEPGEKERFLGIVIPPSGPAKIVPRHPELPDAKVVRFAAAGGSDWHVVLAHPWEFMPARRTSDTVSLWYARLRGTRWDVPQAIGTVREPLLAVTQGAQLQHHGREMAFTIPLMRRSGATAVALVRARDGRWTIDTLAVPQLAAVTGLIPGTRPNEWRALFFLPAPNTEPGWLLYESRFDGRWGSPILLAHNEGGFTQMENARRRGGVRFTWLQVLGVPPTDMRPRIVSATIPDSVARPRGFHLDTLPGLARGHALAALTLDRTLVALSIPESESVIQFVLFDRDVMHDLGTRHIPNGTTLELVADGTGAAFLLTGATAVRADGPGPQAQNELRRLRVICHR